MLERIVVAIITRLGAWLYARILKEVNAQVQAAAVKSAAEQEIEQRLKVVKDAYAEAFNGDPVTEDQRKKLNQTIGAFLRGDGRGL